MVHTLEEARVRAFHCDRIAELRRHAADCLGADSYAEHLKALRWRTPVETLEATWASNAERFRRSPADLPPGPNS
jgi:hypothetical protein